MLNFYSKGIQISLFFIIFMTSLLCFFSFWKFDKSPYLFSIFFHVFEKHKKKKKLADLQKMHIKHFSVNFYIFSSFYLYVYLYLNYRKNYNIKTNKNKFISLYYVSLTLCHLAKKKLSDFVSFSIFFEFILSCINFIISIIMHMFKKLYRMQKKLIFSKFYLHAFVLSWKPLISEIKLK